MSETLPKIAVLFAQGTNCEQETIDAVNMVGGQGDLTLVSDLGRDVDLSDAQGLIIPGGFSFGDHLGSGNVFAQHMRMQFGEEIGEFLEADKPVLGICNGFQVLVRSGILPGGTFGEQTVTLTTNETNQFGHRWVKMHVDQTNSSKWLPELPEEIELPVANKEGRFYAHEYEIGEALALGQVPFVYTDGEDWMTEDFPANPSGAMYGIAGLCTSNVVGLMPHPERFMTPYQYDNWRRFDNPEEDIIPYGRLIFAGMVDYIKQS